MAKIDLEKLICSLAKRKYFSEEKLQGALKEQGLEYKNGEIVESQKPKFKVGDWIVQENIGVYKVIEVCESWYEVVDNKNKHYSISFNKEYMCHLWTIKDAKDGDVLACGDKVTDYPFIFHNLTKELNPRSYCGINTLCDFQDNNENGGYWGQSNEVRPATKEQRDFLFQKMKEAGYEWDADKKKLKKIRKPLYEAGDIIKYKNHCYKIQEVVKNDEIGFYYNLVATDLGKVSSIGPAGEKDIILISNNHFDYEHANIQQKDYSPKEDEELFFGDFRKTDSENTSATNRQVYNRAILKLLSRYVEKYPDITFIQMLFNLDIKPHFDEESGETYWKLNKTINKTKS